MRYEFNSSVKGWLSKPPSIERIKRRQSENDSITLIDEGYEEDSVIQYPNFRCDIIMKPSCNILALEGYYGGSHKALFDGLQKYSRHHYEIMGLPARHWKWRMRGAAVSFATKLQQRQSTTQWDGLLVTDMMNLNDLIALTRPQFCQLPIVLYMHENQVSYPLHPEQTIDYHYPLTNLLSILSATKVVFNSEFNRNDFFIGIQKILSKMPDRKPPRPLLKQKQEQSQVLSPGIDLQSLQLPPHKPKNRSPVILWNHRWERDKQPEVFAQAIEKLAQRGLDFQLILCGEQFREDPPAFLRLKETLSERILHWGYAKSRKHYGALLAQSDLVVSTAIQEFFGISVIEAIAAGAFPVLPKRLNYPYLIPKRFHRLALYEDPQLVDHMENLLLLAAHGELPNLQSLAQSYDWSQQIRHYDALWEVNESHEME